MASDDDRDAGLALRVRRHLRLVHRNDGLGSRMDKLKRSDLYTLEAYAVERPAFRSRVIAHKKLRTLHLGAHMTLVFEDRLSVQYQIQEMLRIERIFEAKSIQDELDAYNPLIPDGSNLKATLLIEYPDPELRRIELARLGGIEHRVFLQVEDQPRCYAIADEDLDRSEGDKTSAVHFLRFEFSPAAIMALHGGAALRIGVDDPRMPVEQQVEERSRRALAADFG